MPADLPGSVFVFFLSLVEALLIKFSGTEYGLRPLTSTVPILFGSNVFARAFYSVVVYPFFVSPLRHLPEPKSGYPHYARSLVLSDRFPPDEYLRWMREIPNDGLIRYRGLFNAETLIPTDTRAHADILVHHPYDFAKPVELRAFLRRFIGDGLINIEGDEHKFQRKAIAPSFSFGRIRDLYPIFWAKALALTRGVAAEIENGAEGGIVEIGHWSTKVTFDIIGLAGLGRDFNALKNHDDPLVAMYDEILEPTNEKRFICLLYLYFPEKLLRVLPWKANRQLHRNTDRLRDACRRLVTEKAQKVRQKDAEQMDILAGLLKANVFSDEGLIDQVLTFLAAGHESTATTFTWGCYLLATHLTVQTRLREEIRSKLACWLAIDCTGDAREPSASGLADALESLPYLNAVCNEISRLYPAVPIVARAAVRDTTIAGHAIPAGTYINLAPWAINRSSAHWGPNPEGFNPERWLDADGHANNAGGSLNNYAYLTFFHGPRSCVGQRFSMAELRALVATFVARFEFELGMREDEVVRGGFVTVKPKNGIKLKIKELRY